MMEAELTSETPVENHFTKHYIPEDNSEHYKMNFTTYFPTNMFGVLSSIR
jgi:hypothetical protein